MKVERPGLVMQQITKNEEPSNPEAEIIMIEAIQNNGGIKEELKEIADN